MFSLLPSSLKPTKLTRMHSPVSASLNTPSISLIKGLTSMALNEIESLTGEKHNESEINKVKGINYYDKKNKIEEEEENNESAHIDEDGLIERFKVGIFDGFREIPWSLAIFIFILTKLVRKTEQHSVLPQVSTPPTNPA